MSEKSTLWSALLRVQSAVRTVKRDATNPHFKSKYTTLEAVYSVLRQPMAEAGLVLTQMPRNIQDGNLELVTRITHVESGEALENSLHIPVIRLDPQGLGSAITYACRYGLMPMLALAPSDDDDGEFTRKSAKRVAPDGSEVPSMEEAVEACEESIMAIKDAIKEEDLTYAKQLWDEISPAHKMALWVAPSKGGPFTTSERDAIKRAKS